MDDTGGARTSYGYDLADRLVSVKAPSAKLITLDYDQAGRRTAVRYPNGLNAQAAFETATGTSAVKSGRLASIAHGLNFAGQGGSALNLKLGTVSYSYDVKGNIIAANENATVSAPPSSGELLAGAPLRHRAYTLDAIERLTDVKDGSGTSIENYTLDAEGNRITSHLASFHVTDVANRLNEDEKHQFEYDVNGNMVRKTMKTSGATWRYAYTVWDELKSAARHAAPDASSPVLEKISYTFDALGRRLAERRYDGSGALTGGTNFHYDGDHVAHEAAIDATGAVIAGSAKWTTYSDGTDDLLAITLQAGTGPSSPTAYTLGADMPAASSYYYHTDHQGSVRAITDQTGQVTNAYAYDAYGNAQESVESLAQRFRYTGREWDAVTSLYHYRARAFDAETGRFLQEDPIGLDAGDMNVYRMTWNNPVNWTDPSGMSATAERGSIDSIGLTLLRGGQIATRAMLSTGIRTAQFQASGEGVAASGIAARLACTFFTLADAVAKAGPNTQIVGVNTSTCGVVAMSVPDDDPLPRSVPLPPLPKRGCTCVARADANLNIASNTPAFAIAEAWAMSCPEAAKKAEALAKAKLGQQPKHVKKRCNGR